jgi:hypothetical protein
MQRSVWDFAIVETIHLIALAALGGSVLAIDLRLLGIFLPLQPARLLARDLSRTLLASLAIMILTGFALVSEEALKCYHSPAFRWKMLLLLLAIIFYFTLHRRALIATDRSGPSLWTRTAAVVSLTLWFGVGVAGRAIGLL